MVSNLKTTRYQPAEHYSLFYTDEVEREQVLLDFFQEGLALQQRVVYLAEKLSENCMVDSVIARLPAGKAKVDRGQIQLFDVEETYLADGVFDPDRMIRRLEQASQEALADGWEGLRITGEMTWALRGHPGSERLAEYESRLNRFFPDSNVTAICQYDTRIFEGKKLCQALSTHPGVIVGREAYANPFYLTPEQFETPARAANEFWRSILLMRGI